MKQYLNKITPYLYDLINNHRIVRRVWKIQINIHVNLRELGTEMINFKNKDMISLTNKEIKSYEKQKVCYIFEKRFCDGKNKKSGYDFYHKVRYHGHFTGKCRGAAHNICNLRYNIPKKISIAFHNGSAYDYHFVIKKFAEEFKDEFECLGENTEKYITFSAPFRKKEIIIIVKKSHIN